MQTKREKNGRHLPENLCNFYHLCVNYSFSNLTLFCKQFNFLYELVPIIGCVRV